MQPMYKYICKLVLQLNFFLTVVFIYNLLLCGETDYYLLFSSIKNNMFSLYFMIMCFQLSELHTMALSVTPGMQDESIDLGGSGTAWTLGEFFLIRRILSQSRAGNLLLSYLCLK